MPRVLAEVSLQHVYISRKSRSNSEPFKTGYVFRQDYENPVTFTTFDPSIEAPHPEDITKQIDTYTSAKGSLPKRDLALIQKSMSKYNSRFLPSKLKTDDMYENLKSAMHYQPPIKSETIFGYENEYHIDDDDVRTSSRGIDDRWPYYNYNPYQYEHMRIDAEREKAKDKRYEVDVARVIPIHEDLSHDIPYSQEPLLTTEYYYSSTDNPMSGHGPFFSFMLNDYFNKNYDNHDELTLKGIDWGKDFDQGKGALASRIRRLPSDSNMHHKQNEVGTSGKSESVTEKAIDNQHKFNKHEKGDEKKANDQSKFHQNEQKHTGFKDFVDSFANKFGSEDHMKDSNYLLKSNQDKGEKRKGFRRVYHKNEYQEDNEFYDNNNSSARSEDKGSSKAHIGGSEGLLKSTAYANLGNESSAYDKSGNTENNIFKNNHEGHDKNYGHNLQLHRYQGVANQAAQSNDADYSIH